MEIAAMAEESKGILSTLRHPLFLLVVGSVIGSFLIPWISQMNDRNRILREARLKKSVEIVENNTRTISQLNQLLTRLGMFHVDNRRLNPSPKELKQRQDKVAEDANNLYLEFNKTAWWWYEDLRDEALILKTVDDNTSQSLTQHIDAYSKNISDSVVAVRRFWHACVASDYDYRSDEVSKLYDDAHNILKDSSRSRQQLLRNLINDFRQ